ncbi:uncharacterized protein LOC117333234 [Pecten maximus]|uniref:uncharacterized protein LOC117333234 n=1 Tax=Pecten maximus TaxID=6579 RepID=UPI0014583EE3|nr:uncharacterized protein LOC117333234 [Pecten maximus]XP_033748318.1 uncharacterized protein LOC117333234 [Pecten maximus]
MLAGMIEGRYDQSSSVDQLLLAATLPDTSQLCTLLNAGTDVNAQNEVGQTALLSASLANNVDSCRLLLEKGSDIRHRDVGGYSALHLTQSAEVGELILCQASFQDGNDDIVNMRTKEGRTPLHEAVLHGPLDRVNSLLKRNSLINTEDEDRTTPLHYACSVWDKSEEPFQIIERLLQAGADVNRQTAFLKTPLLLACAQQCLGVGEPGVNILLNHGADPSITDIDGNTALHALLQGDELGLGTTPPEVVDRLVKIAPEILTSCNKYGEHPIHLACRRCVDGDEYLVRHMINLGADVHARDSMGRNLLHLCCMYGKEEEDVIMSKYPVLANEVDCLGRTVLHYNALLKKEVSQIENILKLETFNKLSATDTFGFTAFDYAVNKGHVEAIELFKTYSDTTTLPAADGAADSHVVGNEETLDRLLSPIVVETFDYVLPETLRPIQDADVFLMDIWDAGSSPTKNAKLFSESKAVVETFMNKVVSLMREKDDRFSGTLIGNGSSYEGTKIGNADEYDFLLQLDDLSTICRPIETGSDPPGYAKVARIPRADLGKYEDLFDSEGVIKCEKIMSRFSQILVEIMHDPRIWESSGLDYLPLYIKWKGRPALTISCTQRRPGKVTMLSIDFLPALYFKNWRPCWMRDDMERQDNDVRNIGCHMIIKPADVPYYQHAQFGMPRHFLRITFSRAETVLFNSVPDYIRKSYMIAKHLVKRNARIPLHILFDIGDLHKSKTTIIGKHNINSYFVKQCLLKKVMDDYPVSLPCSEEEERSLTTRWVRTIFKTIHMSYENGNLPSAFMPSQNLLHTYKPDPSTNRIRHILFQLVNHSIVKESVPTTITRGEYTQREPGNREMKMDGKMKLLKRLLYGPQERV